ncbi:XamI family restriction endonuclease [Chloroflexota bacterium]
MPVNRDKPDRWKKDIAQSVDFYNDWFMQFAPATFRETRVETTKHVESALDLAEGLTKIMTEELKKNPNILPMLRMSTCPPIARDRLIGLARVSPNLVKVMEQDSRLPPQMRTAQIDEELLRIVNTVRRMVDPDIFPWLESNRKPTDIEVRRAATIVADRLCGAVADPIIRNAQERRQLAAISAWLENRNYGSISPDERLRLEEMRPGTFGFRVNVPVTLEDGIKQVNIPIDVVIVPKKAKLGQIPLLLEAKSAGDFTNPNKRRKEEAVKMTQLRNTYGNDVPYNLFLCGYFDSGYLGYEAAEGIDWVWEHRIDDLAEFGL